MEHGQASKTAMRVAMRRAAHQMIDRPLVLHDALAVKIVQPLLARDGHNYEIKRSKHKVSKAFRSYMVGRSRYAEDELARAVAGGVRQYVVLGAGLDTFGCRNANPDLQVYELDFPATQAWKRDLLRQAGIAAPGNLHFVPVDFGSMNLADELMAAGFDRNQSGFFSWLGVTMYLTLGGFRKIMQAIGSGPAGSAVSLDFLMPRESLPAVEQTTLDGLAKRVAAAGEPLTLFLTEAEMAAECRRAGFERWEFLDAGALNRRYFADRTDGLGLVPGAARLATAWK
jgi:methyltransferase (TIGR00027 family)